MLPWETERITIVCTGRLVFLTRLAGYYPVMAFTVTSHAEGPKISSIERTQKEGHRHYVTVVGQGFYQVGWAASQPVCGWSAFEHTQTRCSRRQYGLQYYGTIQQGW